MVDIQQYLITYAKGFIPFYPEYKSIRTTYDLARHLHTELTTLPQDLKFLLSNFNSYVNYNDRLFYITIASICFNPIFWNIVARAQYKNHFITKYLTNGSAKLGCYILAVIIFSLGIVRDSIYHEFLKSQPTYAPLEQSILIKLISIVLFGFGNLLVLSSMYMLGVTGTYLGDYFGILMKERVTGFPFNINDNPMYNGSTLCFLGVGLYYGKPSGILISLFVFIMYKIALLFEEPFTAKIYANRDKKEL